MKSDYKLINMTWSSRKMFHTSTSMVPVGIRKDLWHMRRHPKHPDWRQIRYRFLSKPGFLGI